MIFSTSFRRKVSASLLIVYISNLLVPSIGYSLTSGPAQPETQAFQPAGVSDMVDLVSGDFKYNIPLLDVDGYPINLNYQSGINVDDEASWVGLGWNLNVGAINRQLRGIPDDMAGDNLTVEHRVKDKVTVGGRLTAKVETKGAAKLGGSFSLGVFSDNYTGIGAELGVNAGLSLSLLNSGTLTGGMGIGVLSNTSSGVDFTPSLSLSVGQSITDKATVNAGLSASLGSNTRSGMKSLTLGSSFGASGSDKFAVPVMVGPWSLGVISGGGQGAANYSVLGSSVSYNTEPIIPKVQMPYLSRYGSFSFDIGGVAWVLFAGGGGTGYKNVRSILNPVTTSPEYGFLYAELGKDKKTAVMDFTREKENPVIPELPNLALPVHTPDLFSYTSQAGAGQFRLYRGSGAFFDNEAIDESEVSTLGFDAGFGAYFHGGVTHFEQAATTTTRKWQQNNSYLRNGDFQKPLFTDPSKEHVFFKMVGERNVEDKGLTDRLHGTAPLAVNINQISAQASFHNNASSNLSAQPLTKNSRQLKRSVVSYLSAEQAVKGALDKLIKVYPLNTLGSFNPPVGNQVVPNQTLDRNAGIFSKHHLSEISVTDDGGKRMVYGIPVYNVNQEEYTFAIGRKEGYTSLPGGQVILDSIYDSSIGAYRIKTEGKGVDNYFHKEKQPAYASSFLLTAILSPDYVDRANDGITHDDAGTAIKFNYSKIDGLYNWRTPYPTKGTSAAQHDAAQQNATINKGLLADPDDNKAIILYGQKELYYVHSIETKTQIAYFITEDRKDALGVKGYLGGIAVNGTKQRCLREIRLYSKADIQRPVKVVKFEYDYSLCPGTPNSMAAEGGKLTLKKVWFEYGDTDKGKHHPYVFNYKNVKLTNNQPAAYAAMSTDRWGVFKPAADNQAGLDNDEFPYSVQSKAKSDDYASLWHLSSIELPTGGKIQVDYESDDYAYVQDKKAMTMAPILAYNSGATNLIDATGFKIAIDSISSKALNTSAERLQWFKDTYLNGSDYLYTKCRVRIANTTDSRLSGGEYWDFVPVHCKVTNVDINATEKTATVYFENQSDGGVSRNPVVFAAWQRMKNDYPRYAYPGYMNRVGSGTVSQTVAAAVTAIVNAAASLDELRLNFYKKARNKGFCSQADLAKSFVRIAQVSGNKLGGGVRVKRIKISDEWNSLSSDNGAASSYGQEYDYTTIYDGKKVSSGVASYEPAVGNDENPFRQPVPYVQKIKGALNNFFSLEEPFGESFFPGPSVAYSKVTVRDLDASGTAQKFPKTGFVEHEFYTAREFPTETERLAIDPYHYKPRSRFSLVKSDSYEETVLSQGYSVTLNDMHGKAKSTKVYNQSGAEVSSVEYYYNVVDQNARRKQLRNAVKIIKTNGIVEDGVIGRDIEFFTDFREQESKNNGRTINIGADVVPGLFGIPFPIPHWPKNGNNEYKLFRSVCAVKVIQYFGVIDKVVKKENGSEITTENVAYDGLTGEALVTRTQNEFDQYIYSVNLPAYWAYKGMSGAYQNLGTILKGVSTSTSGAVLNFSYLNYLQPGDMLIDINSSNGPFWVVETGGSKRLIDKDGKLFSGTINLAKIIRSGFRNLLQANTSSFVCMNNPITIVGGQERFALESSDLSGLKVINASSNLFDEEWAGSAGCAALDGGIENTSLCFTFCTGDYLSQYGKDGAHIMPVGSNSYTAHIKSSLWGGTTTCDNSNNFSAMKMSSTGTASTSESKNTGPERTETPVDSSALKKSDTKTKKKKKRDDSEVSTMSMSSLSTGTSPSSCQRSFYGSASCDNYVPLLRSGISLCSTTGSTEWVGFEHCLDVPSSGYYYFGFGADNEIAVSVDGVWKVGNEPSSYSEQFWFFNWFVKPVYLTAGKHVLEVALKNNGGNSAAGLEIYNNTYQELTQASYIQELNILFTTASVRGQSVQGFRTNGSTRIYRFTNPDGSKRSVCSNSATTFNPYINGFLGNWRASESKVYQEEREYKDLFGSSAGVDVKNAGYFKTFNSWWHNTGSGWVFNTHPKWVTANRITLYDKYGQELENVDALGRYSAAKFDFNGELPGAVASNAMNREIYSSTFEDNQFKFVNSSDLCDLHEFTAASQQKLYEVVTSTEAHTGNFSAILPTSGVTLETIVHNERHKENSPYYQLNANNEFIFSQTPGRYSRGFEPIPGKTYLFSAWVKDNQPANRNINISLNTIFNNTTTSVDLKCKAVVEQWKLYEGEFTVNAVAGQKLSLRMAANSSGILIDDIRIHPVEAQLKAYAYDERTMKLMAELDENGFATFYEYDDEGSLIRVKKETERGIKTLKESRSSYRKRLY